MSSRLEQFKDMLAELAEGAMALSRDQLEKSLAAEARDDKIAYAQAHERAARSVRLSIALHQKLERGEREPAAAALSPNQKGLIDRQGMLRAAVRHSIRQEYEGEDVETLETALNVLLDEYVMDRGFAFEPLRPYAASIRKTLGLHADARVILPPDQADRPVAAAGASP